MEWILQTLMMMGAAAASIFIHRDSPNFEVVQGMMAILALVGSFVAQGSGGKVALPRAVEASLK